MFLRNDQEIIALNINISSWVDKELPKECIQNVDSGLYPRDLRQGPGIHILTSTPGDSGASHPGASHPWTTLSGNPRKMAFVYSSNKSLKSQHSLKL